MSISPPWNVTNMNGIRRQCSVPETQLDVVGGSWEVTLQTLLEVANELSTLQSCGRS